MNHRDQPSAESGQEQPARLTAAEESAARLVVAGHRARLDWLLRVPEFEQLHTAGLQQLGLAGRRQGIGLRAAVMALPLENKFQLVRWILSQHRGYLPSATAQSMCRIVAVERFNALDLDQVLTARQWATLRRRVSWRLGRDHARYKHAQQLLFTGFGHLVERNVDQLVFDGRHRADCVQEGSLGLLQAIDRVGSDDQDFAAYARTWIRRAIRNFLMRQRLPVHAPINLISKASSARKEAASGSDESSPSTADDRLRALILECLRKPAVSIDESLADEPTLREQLWDPFGETPADQTDRSDLRRLVLSMLDDLTPKQRAVLNARYGLETGRPQTLAEIARWAGISHQQVSMREKRALERLQTLARPMFSELWGR